MFTMYYVLHAKQSSAFSKCGSCSSRTQSKGVTLAEHYLGSLSQMIMPTHMGS